MYLSEEVLRLAFKGMANLDASSVGGKSRQERASAISYLISVSHVLKLLGQKKLDLGVDHVENRQALKDAVEDFLNIPGSVGFTVDFHTKFSEGTGVSSNFLTTVVAGTRGRTTTKEYPGRPAPLLSIYQEKVEILANVKATLDDVYGLGAFKVPLVLWVLKETDFEPGIELDAASLNSKLAEKFETKISSALKVKDEELNNFCQDNLHGSLSLVIDMPNVEDLYNPQLHVNQNSIQASETEQYIGSSGVVSLPKPFLLLAGISGTGKSRFVRKQAEGDAGCYELVPVRPDWHEPSDLLGYVSRINGERYLVTPFLKFLVNAWTNAFASYENGTLTLNNEMKTYWLCLDEMNLAPVEQYFADYLSVLETRSWENGSYSTYPLIQPAKLELEANNSLRIGLGLAEDSPLWKFFMEKGIQLAPNLVVAGTVNMDETTHGFSRKVIDRAYTIDFGDFFPNHFEEFFAQKTRPKKLGYSCFSSVDRSEPMSVADPLGEKSIEFLTVVNDVFKDTAFQLAFRALNELLVTVKCFAPADQLQLHAVWDDFLMAKLLPRVEGDLQKIGKNEDSLLKKLGKVLETYGFDGSRPDLLSESVSGESVDTSFRSPNKLLWMQKRLEDNGFTSFWP